jgi:hypothetical protein
MYKAIVTKYHPQTNHLPSRMSVRFGDNPAKFYPYLHGVNVSGNHRQAAERYEFEHGLTDEDYALVSGELPNGTYAHVTVKRGTV